MANLASLQQALVSGGLGDFGVLIAGIVILAFGILMNYVVPNRLWMIVVVIGVIVAIIGLLILLFGPLW